MHGCGLLFWDDLVPLLSEQAFVSNLSSVALCQHNAERLCAAGAGRAPRETSVSRHPRVEGSSVDTFNEWGFCRSPERGFAAPSEAADIWTPSASEVGSYGSSTALKIPAASNTRAHELNICLLLPAPPGPVWTRGLSVHGLCKVTFPPCSSSRRNPALPPCPALREAQSAEEQQTTKVFGQQFSFQLLAKLKHDPLFFFMKAAQGFIILSLKKGQGRGD